MKRLFPFALLALLWPVVADEFDEAVAEAQVGAVAADVVAVDTEAEAPDEPLQLEVGLLANGSAVLMIDGRRQRLRDGETSPEGVRLIRATRQEALVEYQGEQMTLTFGSTIASRYNSRAAATTVRIAGDGRGHYVTQGRINGHSVTFLVDTGATHVALGRREAERLGIDYRRGVLSHSMTANGITQVYLVTLDRVAVGGIEVNHVQGSVLLNHSDDLILLGNSFLRAVDMNTSGNTLVLTSRY